MNPDPVIELARVRLTSPGAPRPWPSGGIDWQVEAGQFWAVLGLPGSGKSLLLQTAAGLLPPVPGGHQRLFGRDLATMPRPERLQVRTRIGFVFPDGGRLFGELTVAENVALPLCYHRDCRMEAVAERVRALLDRMELGGFAQVAASRLGRPWRPRVALARALALGPELLLLDHPAGGLDPRQVRWWTDCLARLAAPPPGEGPSLTVVVAADDLRPWLDVAGRFALLEEDRWELLGGRSEVRSSASPLLRELLAQPPGPG